MKICSCCNQAKEYSEFHKASAKPDGLQSSCIVCKREQKQIWRENNRAQDRQTTKAWNAANSDKVSEYQKRHKSKPEIKSRILLRRIKRYNSDPLFRLQLIIKAQFSRLKKGKIGWSKAAKYLGCSLEEFFSYIEKKFDCGMSWENQGSAWQYDHVIPCATFDLDTEESRQQCFHFSNFQPLWAEQNARKSAKLNAIIEPAIHSPS